MYTIRARVMMREARPQELTFELAEMGYQDRSRLRHPLVGLYSKEN
jgi:hypothetical protein